MAAHRVWIAGALGLGLALGHAGQQAFGQEGEAPRQEAPARGRTQAPPRQAAPAREVLDPQATAVVRRMADYLRSLRGFTVTTESMSEQVLEDGQKVQSIVSREVAMQHPNRLRSERGGQLAPVTFVYDGDKIMLRDVRRNVFSVTDAPNRLDDALNFARAQLGVDALVADLLYTDAYRGLTHEARSARYIGRVEVDGVVCDHVAFHGGHADWQLWVETGDRPLPRRYTLTLTDQPSQPEHVVELRDWDLSPTFPAGAFAVTPPPDARRIELAELLETAGLAREHGEQG
jgi:hypothetical protein